VNQDCSKWERDFIRRENSITCEELCKEPLKYVVSMNMWEINQLTDIKPKNSVWIKSSCDPFCNEMELDEEGKTITLRSFAMFILINWLFR